MTTPLTAIKSMCGLLRGGNVTYPVPQEAAAMIEALIAERDAAVAKLAGLLPCDVKVAPATTIRAGCKVETLLNCIGLRREAIADGVAVHTDLRDDIAEGERRATAAIVADIPKIAREIDATLRAVGCYNQQTMTSGSGRHYIEAELRSRLERDHITEAKP